jgi:SRSO17 transposase
MIARAMKQRVPPGVMLGDTAYGSSSEFRQGVRSLGLHYAVAVHPHTTVHLLDEEGGPRDEALSVSELATDIHERGGFRRCTWRKGTREDLSARSARAQNPDLCCYAFIVAERVRRFPPSARGTAQAHPQLLSA